VLDRQVGARRAVVWKAADDALNDSARVVACPAAPPVRATDVAEREHISSAIRT
jgi:hypothetical protein